MTKHDISRLIAHWADSSKYDLGVARALFEKRKYPYALFFCHLAIEKSLKALVVKARKKPADPIHNLVRLAGQTAIEFDPAKIDFLTIVTQFNIQARYQGYKSDFYRKATKPFTKKYLAETEVMLKWLGKMLRS